MCRPRRRPQNGQYGAQILDPLRRNYAWLGTVEDAAKAYNATAVELHGAASEDNSKSPAAVLSSASVTLVKEVTEQGLSGRNREIADEYGDGVEAAERKKKRAMPDAQTKFENVHKYYYRRRKDSRAGRNDGKTFGPVATAVVVPGIVGSSAVRALPEPPSVGAAAGMATPVVGGNLSFSTTNTEEEKDMGSGKMMRFFEGLMKQAMERQEAMLQRFLEAMEKREEDRMIREEAWRRQEMARLVREEILAQDRAMAATCDASVLSFIQKITGQTIPLPCMPPPPSSSQTHVTPIAYAAAAPPSSQTTPPVVHQNSTDILMMHAETPHESHDASGHDGSGGGGGTASSSRWPKAEVHALIQLRCDLDMRRKGPLWEEISAAMRRMGYSRSSRQCRDKWGHMNRYFKKVEKSNKKRPEDYETRPYFHQLEVLYRNKAALGSPDSAGGAAAEHADAAPRDRIEVFTVAAPISQMAPQPHSLPPVDKNGDTNKDGDGHGIGGISVGTQMQASNRFVVRKASGLPEVPVRTSMISVGAEAEEFLKCFTDVVA